MKHNFNNNIKGILWMLIGCFWVSIMAAIIRYVSVDLNVYMINFLRCAFALIALTLWLAISKKKQFRFPLTRNIKLHLLKNIIMTISVLSWMYAISITPLTGIAAIDLVAPIFVMILAVIFLKEKLSIYRIIGTASAIIGALIVIKPGTESFQVGCIIAVFSNFLYAVALLITKKQSKSEGSKIIVFYTFLFIAVFSSPFALYYWQTPSATQLIWLIILGLLSNFIYFSITYSLKKADLAVVIPFELSCLIFTAIIAYFAFGEIIDIYTIIGAIIMVSSIMYIILKEMKQKT